MYRVYYILILSIIILGDLNYSISQVTYFNKRESFISYLQENHTNGLLATDSGYIVAGISTGAFYGYDRINFAFFDLEGNRVSNKSYFGNTGYLYNLGFSGCIINDDINKTLACGYRKDTIANTKDVGLLMKLDQNMDTLWTKIYTDTATNPYNHYYLYQLKQLHDNNLILTGIKKPHGVNTDILLMKTDAQGNMLWEKTYGQGGYNYEYGYSVVEVNNNYFIGGFHNVGNVSESGNPIVLKTDSYGNKLWQKNLGGAFLDGWALVTKDINNELIIGTDIADSMHGSYESYSKINILKMDTTGDIIWSKKYGPSAVRNYLSSIHCNDDGTIVASGNCYDGSHFFGWLLKVNSDGDSMWMRYYDHLKVYSSQNIFNDCKEDKYNGYILCGDLLPWAPDTGNRDIWLVKVDSMGCDTPGCNSGVFIPPLQNNDLNICRVIPNPITGFSRIEYPSLPNNDVMLTIYDSLGKMLLLRRYQSNEDIILNRNHYKAGIFFFRLLVGKQWFTGKFVVI